jgi:hypothetical protein
MVVMSAKDALLAMQAGEVPPRLRVEGDLGFYQQDKGPFPRALPTEELIAGDIIIHDASRLTHWPRIVRCHMLYLWNFKHDLPLNALLEIDAPKDQRYRYARQLYLQNCLEVTHLPELHRTSLRELRLVSCTKLTALAGELVVDELDVFDCPSLSRLPDMLHASRVSLSGCTALTALPDDFVAIEALNLANSDNLASLPDDLETLRVNIANCRILTALPQRLRSLYIDMSGCTSITRWDDPEVTTLRQVSARGCVNLESLPPNLRQIDELDVGGCARLTRLPDELHVTRWIDVSGSGIRTLPASPVGVQVRWNSVNVTGQVAFHPETLTARQALAEENAELRRVMLERIGPERFIAEAQPVVLDADTDAGGVRRLLRVEIPDDEPLVALEVHDPSTGRQYLLRVPPDIETCRWAAAWIAGFDNPNDYQPVMET